MLRHRRRGSSALEFVLVLPVLTALFGAIIELSLYISTMHRVSRIARDSARVGSVVIEGPDADGTLIEEAAAEHAELAIDAAGLSCEGTCDIEAEWLYDEDSEFMVIRVAVTLPHKGVTGYMPILEQDGVRSEFYMLTQQQ